jgi:hypothetical protein
MVKKVDGTKLGSKIGSDINSLKKLFGRPNDKTYKQLYEQKLRERAKKKSEFEYKEKLRTLEKEEVSEKLVPIKKGISKIRDLLGGK